MKHVFSLRSMLAAAAVLIFAVGCDLISGTFVVAVKLVENEDLVWYGSRYYTAVDLTEEEVWEDHAEDLNAIDLVGFELYGDNESETANRFNVYVSRTGSTLDETSTLEDIQDSATIVLQDLPFPASSDIHVTYGQSFDYLVNVDSLKAFTESGGFKLFAFPEEAINAHIDSLIVVVTFTAGN